MPQNLAAHLKKFAAGMDGMAEGWVRQAVAQGGFTPVINELQQQMERQPLVAWGVRRFMSSRVQQMLPSAHVQATGDWLHIAMPGGFLPQILAGGFMQLVSGLTGASNAPAEEVNADNLKTLFQGLQKEMALPEAAGRYAGAEVIEQASALLGQRMQEAGLKPLEQRAVRRSFDEVTAVLARQPQEGVSYTAEEVLQLVEQRAVSVMQELDQRLPAVRFSEAGNGRPAMLSVDIPTLVLQLTQRLDKMPEMPVILKDMEQGLDMRQPNISVPEVLMGVLGAHMQPVARAALQLLQPVEKAQAASPLLAEVAKEEQAAVPASPELAKEKKLEPVQEQVATVAAKEQQTVALNLQTVAAITEYMKAQEAAKAVTAS